MSVGRKRSHEQLSIGEVIHSASITVTEAHVVAFAGITGDFHPLHMNEEFAKKTQFGGRIAHGPLVFSICTGLFTQADPLDTIAFLGMEWRLVRPVLLGDTIHVKSTLKDRRLTSSGDKVILEHQREIINQHNEVVQQGTTRMMMLVPQLEAA